MIESSTLTIFLIGFARYYYKDKMVSKRGKKVTTYSIHKNVWTLSSTARKRTKNWTITTEEEKENFNFGIDDLEDIEDSITDERDQPIDELDLNDTQNYNIDFMEADTDDERVEERNEEEDSDDY